MAILAAFLVISILGLVLGFGLAVAEKRLAVTKDEKLIAVEESMPGANCGGCGFAGCNAYAEALYKGEAELGLCSPGGQALADKIAEILGLAATTMEKKVAYVHCRGNSEVTKADFAYKGMDDCNAAYLLQGGMNSCKEGCLHLGSCMKVCPSDAIYRDEKNMITVDPEKCIGCGKCTKVCPSQVIKLIPANADYVVACNNHEAGAKVRKACQVGCIGCKICQAKFPASGCRVENFLSVVDYSQEHTTIAEASAACPQKCIVPRS